MAPASAAYFRVSVIWSGTTTAIVSTHIRKFTLTADPGLVVVRYIVAALYRVVPDESVSLGSDVIIATEVGVAIVGMHTAACIVSASAVKIKTAADFGLCIVRRTHATCVVRAFAFDTVVAAYVKAVVVRRVATTRVIIQAFAFNNSLAADGRVSVIGHIDAAGVILALWSSIAVAAERERRIVSTAICNTIKRNNKASNAWTATLRATLLIGTNKMHTD